MRRIVWHAQSEARKGHTSTIYEGSRADCIRILHYLRHLRQQHGWRVVLTLEVV